jgi:hypothetical protein
MRPYKIPRYPSGSHENGQARITDRAGHSIYLGGFPEETEQEERLAEMRDGPVHIERHPPARPHPFRRGGPTDGR